MKISVDAQEQEIVTKPQDSEIVLSVKGASKKFCRKLRRSLFYGVQDIATELMGIRRENENLRLEEFWALKDVSLELRRGEALGLVGANGSGKTTLLRIIAGVIKPDTGSVEVNGRLAPLIALGAGFNPILTGRENVRANMSILGLSKKEIDERFDAVVEFAEVGEAIDSPVQTYSSGMAARLGFSSAIHTEPDILLIDEVLSVGDVRFKVKCQRRLGELLQKGVAFIMVSHKSQLIMSVCSKSIYLSKGKAVTSGKTSDVVFQYEKDLFGLEKINSNGAMFMSEKPESKEIGFSLSYLMFKDAQGNVLKSLVSGESANFCIGFKAYKKISNLNMRVKVKDPAAEGDILYLSNWNDQELFEVSVGEHEVQLQMPCVVLGPNTYNIFLIVRDGPINTLELFHDFVFEVKSQENMSQSIFYQPHTWELKSIDEKITSI